MKIKIVQKKNEDSLEYKIGDEFEVDSTWYGGVNVTSKTGIPISLEKEEYAEIKNANSYKILMLNGSSNPKGCTYTALSEIGRELEKEGIEYEIFQIGANPVRDCIGCGRCSNGECVFDDDKVNEFVKKAAMADGFIFGTPVYYAHPSGRILSFLDRAFYSNKKAFEHKPAAAVASARRAGTTASLDVINKYFGISSMITIGSSYWNMVHGNNAQEVLEDKEGLQTMRNIAKNISWILKCISIGKENGICFPEEEKENKTNFIR